MINFELLELIEKLGALHVLTHHINHTGVTVFNPYQAEKSKIMLAPAGDTSRSGVVCIKNNWFTIEAISRILVTQ